MLDRFERQFTDKRQAIIGELSADGAKINVDGANVQVTKPKSSVGSLANLLQVSGINVNFVKENAVIYF